MANPIIRVVKLILDKAAAKKTEADAKKSLGGVDKGLKNLKKLAGKLGLALGAAWAINKARQFTAELFRVGSAIEETGSKFVTVFGGEAAASLDAFIADWGRLAGLTKLEGRAMAATAGAIAQGMGFAQAKSAQFSADILRLAGDLQSFNDVPIEETFAAIRSGITGETEPLKRLGIVLKQSEVNARALTDTGKELTSELTNQEIATARLTLITEKAGVAIGDLERTQDSTANTARRMTTTFRQMKEDIATSVLPVMSLFIDSWAQVTDEMTFAQRAAQVVGDFLTSFVGGLQIAAVELNAHFRTIPARFRIFLADQMDDIVKWAGLAEGLVNRVRSFIGAQSVDWTSGLRESAARLRSEGEADIVAFRILVEQETERILRAAKVIQDTGEAPAVGARAEEEDGFRVPIEDLSAANVDVMDTMARAADGLRGKFGEVAESVKLVNRQTEELSTTATATGEVINAAFGAGIGPMAAGKAKQNAIMALEQTALGIVASLNPFTAPKAAGHFAAAGQFASIAAAWGALAGATGGFGGGGGGGVGGFGGGRDVGGAAGARTEALGPELNIFFTGEGFDAVNPRVQRVVHTALAAANSNIGSNARVRTFRGSIPNQGGS